MNKAGRKILLVLIAVYVLALAALLCWSFFTVPPIRIGSLKRSWIIGNTLVLFARGLVSLHLSAVLFSFSLFFPFTGAVEGKRVFFARLKFMGLVFLVLLLLYAILLEAGLPLGLRMREEALSKIRQADELRIKAGDASSRGQFREARRFLQYALTIFPEDEDLRREADAADRASRLAGQTGKKEAPPTQTSPLLLNMSFDEFLARAQGAFDREDYISAEYYASFALRMDQDHPVPKRIIARARQKLTEAAPGRELRADMEFFRRKQAGADILAEGDVIEAYRYFRSLLEERPEDPDVRHYLRLAYAELRKASFLLSEIPLTALPAAGNPRQEGVVFINKRDEALREFVYIAQVIKTPAAYYALDIESLGLGADGQVLYHFGAPYGKFVEGILLLYCVEDDGSGEYRPEYYVGRRPEGPEAAQVAVSAGPEQLLRMSLGGPDYDGIVLWNLIETAGVASFLGVNPRPLYMAFFSRIFLPFSFFVLSFLAAAYGMRYRSRYAALPPVLCFLFLPLLFLVVILVFHVYLYGLYAVQGFLLSALGFYASLAAFCAIQGLLLFVALLVCARQTRQ
jgi:tetratricopeptide (TPR) repeat protein